MSGKSGKQCGACNACCVDLTIDTPEFKKPGLAPCPHLAAQGCGIYATRFKVCRDFLCGWHLTAELGDDWRPDLSGVLILDIAQASLPAVYRPAGNGVQFLITGGEEAIARPGFAEYVAGLVTRGVGVYLTVAAPHALVNEHFQPVAAAGDVPAMVRTLTCLYRLVVAAKDNRSVLRSLPQLYRLNVEKWRALAKNRSR